VIIGGSGGFRGWCSERNVTVWGGVMWGRDGRINGGMEGKIFNGKCLNLYRVDGDWGKARE
jgi:hypothetical protein